MKRYDIVTCFFFCFFVLFLSFPHVLANQPLNGRTIYIDVGHGGIDPGSVSGNIYEKDINLNIAKFLKEELTRYGAIVYMTREGDYDLSAPNVSYRKKSDFDHRIKKINESNADLYLSIHLNVLNDKKYFGPQVFYNNKNKENETIANYIQDYLNQKLNGTRETRKIPSTTYMYSKLSVKGVLVECGFLSNYQEKKLLVTESYQKKIAAIIAEAIKDYSF